MTPTVAPAPAQDAASEAFLRGLERRGLVFAEAQAGDARLARSAVGAAIAAVRASAATTPMLQWTALFWRALFARHELAVVASGASRDPLGHLAPAPRAALLLMFVTELDAAQASAALGVSPAAYRHALARALDSLHAEGVDDEAIRALREQLQKRIRLGAPTALPATPRSAAPGAREGSHRRLRRAMSIALIACIAALATSYVWHPAFLHRGPPTGPFEPLPAAAVVDQMPPASKAIAGGDFGQLDDPDGERIADDLEFNAWLAAQAPQAMSPQDHVPLPESDTPETSAPETEESGSGR